MTATAIDRVIIACASLILLYVLGSKQVESLKPENGVKAPQPVVVQAQTPIEKALSHSVTVVSFTGSGSGTIFPVSLKDKAGKKKQALFVITACHVVLDCVALADDKLRFAPIFVLQRQSSDDGKTTGWLKADCKLYAMSKRRDFAVLLITERARPFFDLRPIDIQTSLPKVGNEVFTVGSPHGPPLSHMLSAGIVSRHGYNEEGGTYDFCDVQVLKGSSGGGVFNKKTGQYLGIAVRMLDTGTYTMYVPVRELMEGLNDLELGWLLQGGDGAPSYEEVTTRDLNIRILEKTVKKLELIEEKSHELD